MLILSAIGFVVAFVCLWFQVIKWGLQPCKRKTTGYIPYEAKQQQKRDYTRKLVSFLASVSWTLYLLAHIFYNAFVLAGTLHLLLDSFQFA